jgi:creatinine amidohydrolase
MNTTIEWQKYAGSTCIFGVGAFEQHSSHLPMSTDLILADYFVEFLANSFDAMYLPSLTFGTSLEHSGFRGTISLKPETLMQVIRDIIDELERQNFTHIIIVNGHGGNFCLNPVVRDINRTDRLVKILLLNFWEFCDPEFMPKSPDLHSGEWETSLVMALRPELVKFDEIIQSKTELMNFIPSMLTSFGVGTFSSNGAIGNPKAATEEKGIQILASLKKNLLSHVTNWLMQVKSCHRYSGKGGIIIRPLTKMDVPSAVRLKDLARWNQTQTDWEMFLNSNPQGCFAAVFNGKVIATATTIKYENRLAWIGMVLVDPEFREMGIASSLIECAIEHSRDCQLIKLDATMEGMRLYCRLGFKAQYTVHRLINNSVPFYSKPATIGPISESQLESIFAYDMNRFGANRSGLLYWLWSNNQIGSWLYNKNNNKGFCLGRKGCEYYQIGPICAEDPAVAIELLTAQLSSLCGQKVLIDVPECNTELLHFLENCGFIQQRDFLRMQIGVMNEFKDCQYAIAGPELG